MPPLRQVRAIFDDETITVYQAYSPVIAEAAVQAGRFVPPFKRERMTWIKPSFLWMMYRCGWATKPGQERVLAVRISRTGFESALAQSCLSHVDADLYADHAAWRERKAAAPVRVQWDPERSPAAAYVADWTVPYPLAAEVAGVLGAGRLSHDPSASAIRTSRRRPRTRRESSRARSR